VIILGKYVTIFNKTRLWCKCTWTKFHMKLFSSVDTIMEKCFFSCYSSSCSHHTSKIHTCWMIQEFLFEEEMQNSLNVVI
jgi:hypothetical protein